jgi:2-iminobutanoate/2-iminopropanoate deaminase
MPKVVPAIPGSEGRVGAFSQVVEANGFVFLAGQVGDDPTTGTVVAGDIEAETRQVLTNIRRLLNAVWREHFATDPPTRATIGVSGLVPPYRVEIEVVAAR